MKRKSVIKRVDLDFANLMDKIAKERYVKNLDKKELRLPEMTRLLARNLNQGISMDKLLKQPRKEDLRRI